MSQRVALLDDAGTVVNVAEFPDGWDGEEWDGQPAAVIPDGLNVSNGWTYAGGQFARPAERSLVGPGAMTTADVAEATYIDTFPDAPAEVTLDVNGASVTVALDEHGVAIAEVTPSGPGPITVTAVGRDVDPLVITVEEA